jgi:hypothetical protein
VSDLHTLPLLGHDLPEIIPPRLREKAHVWPAPDGWRWEHQCAESWRKDSGFPFAALESAQEGAMKHLKECCS